MNHAIVINGIVTNVIWLVPGTKFSNAIPCNDVPVEIGDTYLDGVFYRNGVRILTPMEQAEQDYLRDMATLIEDIYQEDLEIIDG